jgi:hypothetical protein
MNGAYVDDAPERGRCLNAIALQNAVLCATLPVTVRTTHAWSAGAGRCLRSLISLAATFHSIARPWFPQRQRKWGTKLF